MILISACVGVVSITSWLTTLIAVSSIVTEEYAAETEFDEKKIDGHRTWSKDLGNSLKTKQTTRYVNTSINIFFTIYLF